MGFLLINFILHLIIAVYYLFRHRQAQKATTVPVLRTFDCLGASDFQVPNLLYPASLDRQHARYGATFQLMPLSYDPIIYTVSPENIQEIMSNGIEFGSEPLTGECCAPLFGKGILTTDGYFWLVSRRMLEPYFRKEKIEGLASFDLAIERLIERIVVGEKVDLQPLLLDMVSFAILYLLGSLCIHVK